MKILLATDGSTHGHDAAKIVADLLHDSCDVTILTITFEPEKCSGNTEQPWIEEYRQKEQQKIEQHHKEIEAILEPAGAALQSVIMPGNPRRDILQQAEAEDPDLIVIGACGHSMVSRMVLGSTSDHIATHAPCSVLVVRPQESQDSQSTLRKATVAYDGSRSAREAVAEMLQANLSKELEVNVVSVAASLDFFAGSFTQLVEAQENQEQQELSKLADEIAAMISKSLPQAKHEVVQSSHVGEALVVAAEKNHSDFILLGETGHSLLADWILGSTSKYVLRHAPCSVWISRLHRKSNDPIQQSEN